MKKETPILFSTAMVQAILERRKTMTRRTKNLDFINNRPNEWKLTDKFTHVGRFEREQYVFRFINEEDGSFIDVLCPYSKQGDVLWVREEHYRYGQWIEKEGVFTKRGRQKWQFIPHTDEIRYSDNPPEEFRKGMHNKDPHHIGWYKRLARFMPKSACRVWLEVTDIRVERLQDISEDDAEMEGLVAYDEYSYIPGEAVMQIEKHNSAYGQFKKLWHSINGEESWNQNPWVWVVSFKVLSTTGKPEKLQEATHA